ncbi:MAG: cytochrome b/b6 domain-containing protein, partial [Magnetococcales bacterium]|nr:cytochrome b/b6 domain-containing protein [Magnetococcales bacterium]
AVFKLQTPDKCGACHLENLQSYRHFHHGQLTRLGFHQSAKCFDCHESHKILSVKDPQSTVHPDNRLKTCQQCHDGKKRPLATQGFASFNPHANPRDFARHPQLASAARFMSGLLWSVVLFFLCHSVLWYHRERLERKQGSPAPMPEGLRLDPSRQHIQRFSPFWRALHLLFALAVMTLLLTGMTLPKAHTAWAAVVSHWLGGAQSMGEIHRGAALVLVGIFATHLVALLQRLLRDRQFAWFGPDSLLPNRKDFLDCRDMFLWFFGRGEKPRFERFTYYEKFDYWAVFWGIALIGSSGAVLAFPHLAGNHLEGWIFNVALLVHREEAYLAALFLFTVHLFNNHFRPDKHPPPDIVMFTGRQSLEALRRDHPAQFERLLAEGRLADQCVPPPSSRLRMGAILLGWLLIGSGMLLLFLTVA